MGDGVVLQTIIQDIQRFINHCIIMNKFKFIIKSGHNHNILFHDSCTLYVMDFLTVAFFLNFISVYPIFA